MKFFIDTANLEQIREAYDLGVLDGVTTLSLIHIFGSSVLHPEASRITFLASVGKRGLAQSLFQVGGNLGGSLGPLLVALLVAPYGRHHIASVSYTHLDVYKRQVRAWHT